MSTSHLKEIFKLGHEIGLHGYNHDWYSYLNEKNQEKETFKENREMRKVGRNEKCPCGSGKKFKNCHGNV